MSELQFLPFNSCVVLKRKNSRPCYTVLTAGELALRKKMEVPVLLERSQGPERVSWEAIEYFYPYGSGH